jgi:protein-disulfide isomerase
MSIPKQGLLQPDVGPNDHHAGPADAPITLVEYGDFQCPWCFRAHPIVLDLQRQFEARLHFVFRNFPLTQLHPHAMHAAEAAESVNAASGRDAYWRMHHLIYQHQQDALDALDDARLFAYAENAGADPARVQYDLEVGAHRDRVMADFASGLRSGVNGTPTFFINGLRFDGNWLSPAEFARELERAAAAAAGLIRT